LTENDEGEVPHYVPSCIESSRERHHLHHHNGSTFFRNHTQKNESLTQAGVSPRQNLRNYNQSVDAIYNSAVFDLVKQSPAPSENHNL